MPTQNSTGSHTTTTSLDTIKALSAAKNLVMDIDVATMADGDEFYIEVTKKVLTGGSEVILETMLLGPIAPAQKNILIGPFQSLFTVTFKIQKTAGTNRTFPWSLVEL